MTAQEFVNHLNETAIPKLGYVKHLGRFWWPKFIHDIDVSDVQRRKEQKLIWDACIVARSEYVGYSKFESPNDKEELIILH